MPFKIYIFHFLFALVATVALTPLTFRLAWRWRAISHVNHRSSHTIPTPRLGGIALAAGMAFGFIGGLLVEAWLDLPRLSYLLQNLTSFLTFFLHWWVAMGCVLMFVLGVADDCTTLPARLKLFWMIDAVIVAVILAFLGPMRAFEQNFSGLLAAGLAAIWLLYFTNAFNFMDGMDGFATSFAGFAAAAFYLCLCAYGREINTAPTLPLAALAAMSGACWGFYMWNRPPARTFMGDAGSLSLGFALAAIVPWLNRLTIQHSGNDDIPIAVSLTILMPFVFDSALTLIRRALRGENVMEAHREHLYQRLMQTGWSHARVLYLNWLNFILCDAAALCAMRWYVLSESRYFGQDPWFQWDRKMFPVWIAFAFSLAVQCCCWRFVVVREAAKARAAWEPSQ